MISLEYAKALYDLGLETKQTKVFEQELATMLELLKNEETKAFFASYNITRDVKKGLVQKFSFSTLFTNFLCLLIDKDRFFLLEEIEVEFKRLDEEKHHIIHFTIYSPQLLEKERLSKLEKILATKYPHKQIKLLNLQDQDLIGGLKIYKDDEILDLSIIGQLDDLKTILERR